MAVCLSGSSEVLTEMKDIECYSNVSLPCEAGYLGPKFCSLTWYKNRTGVLRWIWNDTKRGDYWRMGNVTRQAALGPEGQLILPRVTPNDTGTYKCFLRANLGEQNLESSVYLSVNVTCVEPVTSTPSSCPLLDVLEMHAAWATLGFISLSLLKIILCVVVIKVLAKLRPSQSYNLGSKRSQRSQR
ncbi:hypothetical protein AALO_G00055920 [Alosa alosa]|uniref:Ig-like domain-containing protein n=1 Tax=Alosa alosa TaxID=278164 RepID=A0AAV6H580_9TELE|nr:hypothetical protein AALO_G00055920 [Alosa alosa]